MQQAACNVQQAACNVQQAACNVQQAACNVQQAAVQRATDGTQRATCGVQRATGGVQRATDGRATCNMVELPTQPTSCGMQRIGALQLLQLSSAGAVGQVLRYVHLQHHARRRALPADALDRAGRADGLIAPLIRRCLYHRAVRTELTTASRDSDGARLELGM